jgi:hypothetical protein
LLTKAVFAKDILSETSKKISDEEDISDETRHVTAVENELRAVLNDLEQQLNLSEKSHMHGKKRGGKINNKYHI